MSGTHCTKLLQIGFYCSPILDSLSFPRVGLKVLLFRLLLPSCLSLLFLGNKGEREDKDNTASDWTTATATTKKEGRKSNLFATNFPLSSPPSLLPSVFPSVSPYLRPSVRSFFPPLPSCSRLSCPALPTTEPLISAIKKPREVRIETGLDSARFLKIFSSTCSHLFCT